MTAGRAPLGAFAFVLALLAPLAAAAADWDVCRLGVRAIDRAIAACTRVVDDPAVTTARRANALVSRAAALQQQRRLDEALADLDRAVRLAPRVAYVWQSRGELRSDRKEYRQAIDDISRAIALDPRYAFRYHARASACREAGDLDCALRDFTTAIARDQSHDFRYGDRANVFKLMGRWREAIDDLDQVTRINPGYLAAYWRRAEALIALGDPYAAVEQSTIAIARGSQDPEAFEFRAKALDALGQTDGARADRDRAAALRRENGTIVASPAAPPKTPPQTPVATRSNCGGGRRVALVVGNAAYPTAPLVNAANDADGVARILQDKLCFSVIEAKNANREVFQAAVNQFAEASRDADIALFYFAGHGLQLQQSNILLPVDARLSNEYEALHANVSAQDVVSLIEARAASVLVFLDACRDNPIDGEFRSRMASIGRSVGVQSGVAPIRTASVGTLVVYSTRPNNQASDGRVVDGNSPFTRAFLKHVTTPGKDILLVVRDIAADVWESTGRTQRPQQLTDMLRSVVLLPAP